MKVKNLFKEKKKCASESSESRTNILATQSQYQKQKIANGVSARPRHCGNPASQSEKAPRKTEKGPI